MIKKSKHMLRVALLCAICSISTQARAEILMSDDFDYSVGDLYSQGSWVKLTTNTAEPIQVVNDALSFAGYQGAPAGKAAKLDGSDNSKAQRLQKAFASDGITSGTLYYSMLVKPTECPQTNSAKYIFAGFSGKNFNGWGDGVGNTSPYAAASLTKGSAEGKFKFGIAASTSTPTLTDAEYDLNSTYLVVVKYDFSSKDIAMWINPADASAAPTITLAGKGSISTTNGVQAMALYQQGSPNAMAALTVDAVRVATSMADLFDGSSAGEDPGTPSESDAKVTLSTQSIDFGAIFNGKTASEVVTITAEDLDSDLSVTSTAAQFKVSPASISKAAAEAGAQFTVTFSPTAAGSFNGTICIKQGDTVLAEIKAAGTAVAVNTPMNYAYVSNGLYEGTLQPDSYYFLESKFAVVTHVDTANKRFFIQDMVGAIAIDCSMMESIPVKVGDKFTKYYVFHSDGTLYLMDGLYETSAITEGTPKQPTPYRLSDIQFDPQSYWNKLVTIEDLTFAEAGELFAAASTQATDPDGKSISVRPFADTDLIGATIPAKGSVTGILVSKTGAAIWPRSAADVEGAEIASALDIAQKLDFDGIAAPINADTRFATFTVKATDLEKPVQIWLGGANRNVFSLSTESIPEGTGTYEVVVTYHPTAIGSHKATVNFDASPVELSGSFALAAKAYDPQNPPTLTVPASVEAFSSTPGVTQQKTIVVSSAHMFDYGSIIIESQSTPGTFTLNTSSFMYNMDANVVISFRPLQAGEYTATLKVSAPMATDRYILISGTCEGDTPAVPTEGGALTLDTSAPMTLLIENFDGVPHNKALSLDGWSNVAVKGTRAWWGYTFADDGNSAAKVTAYDSQMSTDEPCEMLLVTPALDFVNSASKIFTCRIMGDFLPSESAGTPIEVLYIEDKDYMQVLDGMGIPTSADSNKEWIDYVIDLEGLDLADVFFIGFRLKSDRGRNNTSVYYVDDVSWGRTDVPQIKVSQSYVTIEGCISGATISEEITVQGLNLTDSIKLKVSGANASKFTVDPATLPADGGTFTITFSPEEAGVHEAYIELSSAGAPTVLVAIEALGTQPSGIDSATIDLKASQIYNLQGIRMNADHLPAGLYIIDGRLRHISTK